MENKLVCATCGTQMPQGFDAALNCPICSEERQYVPENGQIWTTHTHLLDNNTVKIKQLNEKLFEFVVNPTFAIGQRALLLCSDSGNILWDCIPLLDKPTIDFIQSKGGLKAIVFSHPHYYSNMNDWAAIFNCPIYIHQSDEQWILDKGENVKLWSGTEQLLWDGVKIINIGGHFTGSCVLHIPSLSNEGTILCGDTMYLSPSKKHFAIMYSYPNRIPLPISEIKRIKGRFDEIRFDSIYGFYSYQNLVSDAKDVLNQSLERYLK
jgi:hypothetical protein